MDFSGPLALAARHFPKIRFNVFSDCAFIATSQEYAKDLLAAIRFAFAQWVADGILVRGGLAIGNYDETKTWVVTESPENFTGNLFSGSAVTEAVRLENLGPGALLFVSNPCVRLYGETYEEPIFTLEEHKIIGWSDDDNVLYWFIGISFIRLLRLLNSDASVDHETIEKLRNNILYSLAISDAAIPRFLLLAILSSNIPNEKARKEALKLFSIDEPDDFEPYQELIDGWLEDKQKLLLLKTLSDMDSSVQLS